MGKNCSVTTMPTFVLDNHSMRVTVCGKQWQCYLYQPIASNIQRQLLSSSQSHPNAIWFNHLSDHIILRLSMVINSDNSCLT